MSEHTLTTLTALPEGLLEREARRLHEILPGPTLLHLPGRDPHALFVSVLLHGNEDTGWEAVRGLLQDAMQGPLPRAMSIFIGNVAAARYGRRVLEGQADFNRVWDGGEGREAAMAAEVLAAMRLRQPALAVDIHNNTGKNPHYACINRLDARFFQLAARFGRTVVYFIRPEGVLSAAFADLCPAVTLECGRPGDPAGVAHARAYLDALLAVDRVPNAPPQAGSFDLFHTVAVVRVNADCALRVAGAAASAAGTVIRPPAEAAAGPAVGVALEPGAGPELDSESGSESGNRCRLVLPGDLDRLNFLEVPPGTPVAQVESPSSADDGTLPIEAINERGAEVAGLYFARTPTGQLLTRRPVMLSMLTLDPAIIRQDCLCYLMERLDQDGFIGGIS